MAGAAPGIWDGWRPRLGEGEAGKEAGTVVGRGAAGRVGMRMLEEGGPRTHPHVLVVDLGATLVHLVVG